jgi:diguanylate cyclase (GGDEF)-like protein
MRAKKSVPDSGLGESGRLMAILTILLFAGFGLTSLFGFLAARSAIRGSISSYELPATADGIYERILRDLVRPVFISSMMADDSFLHDWARSGEGDAGAISRYLSEIKRRYGAFTAFFVSERTRRYYTSDGVLKSVAEEEPRDAWYFRVRKMAEAYELNVDPDMANQDALTVFINYRVLSSDGKFLGAAGVGINVSSLSGATERYSKDYGASVFFVDQAGRILAGSPALLKGPPPATIAADKGLAAVDLERAKTEGRLASEYLRAGQEILLSARYVPELKWFVFVEKPERETVRAVQDSLWLNLGVCALVIALVLLATALTVRKYQSRLERTASTDRLTGTMNRHAFHFVIGNAIKKAARDRKPFSVLMLDIDDFKRVNDERGHAAGDEVLASVARGARGAIRDSDFICRWGGEEFLVALPDCSLAQAAGVAEKLRTAASRETAGFGAVTLSAGAAQIQEGESFESLTARADEALLRAKRQGKDRVAASN